VRETLNPNSGVQAGLACLWRLDCPRRATLACHPASWAGPDSSRRACRVPLMDVLLLQTLLTKLKQVSQSTAMATAAVGLSRAAAGAGTAPPAAAAAGGAAHRGLRAVAAAASSSSPGVPGAWSAHWQQPQSHPQQQQQRGVLSPLAAPWHAGGSLGRRPAAPPSAAARSWSEAAVGLQHLAPGSVGRRPQHPQQRQHRQLSRQYATAAAQLAAEDAEEEVAVGSIIEFERGREYHIGRAIKPLAGAQGWQVEAARCAGCVSTTAACCCRCLSLRLLPSAWSACCLI
jgi:hypothetical protein